MPLAVSIWPSTLTAAQQESLRSLVSSEILPRPDVLVVGGGLIGLATAYFLAEQGASVQLVTAGTLADGASGTNAGGIWPNDQGLQLPPGFQPLAHLSRDMWARLSLQPGFDFDWRVNGFLNVRASQFGPDASAAARQAQERGFSATAVDAEQIQWLEPKLSRSLVSGLHFPSEAHVNPLKGALAFARGALRKQARLATGVPVQQLILEQGRVLAVETAAGRICPGSVVAATGWQAEWLQPAFEQPLPLRPVMGQMIALEAGSPLLKSGVSGDVLLIPLRTGEILVGASVVETADLLPDPEVTRQFLLAAHALLPELEGRKPTHVWCGLRPGSPDGLPLIDRSPRYENLWVSCGHFRNGVLLAPVSGKLVAEWVLGGDRSQMLEPCRLDRFAVR